MQQPGNQKRQWQQERSPGPGPLQVMLDASKKRDPKELLPLAAKWLAWLSALLLGLFLLSVFLMAVDFYFGL